MLIYAFLIVLLIRPSWGLLWWFTAIAAALWAIVAQLHRPMSMFPESLGEALGHSLWFLLFGAVIVAVRGSIGARNEAKRTDKLVEEARAEAAARGESGNA